MSLGKPKVVKGSMTLVNWDANPALTDDKQTLTFHFNPDRIVESHPPGWGSESVPGRSDPVFQWGGGKGRSISFSLFLDGDRGRMNRVSANSGRRNPLSGPIASTVKSASGANRALSYVASKAKYIGGVLSAPGVPSPPEISLNPRAFTSSLLPRTDPNGLSIQTELDWLRRLSYPGREGQNISSPNRVWLSMGALYQRIECIVEVGDITISYFTPKLEPVRATVPVVCRFFTRQPVFRNQVYSGGRL